MFIPDPGSSGQKAQKSTGYWISDPDPQYCSYHGVFYKMKYSYRVPALELTTGHRKPTPIEQRLYQYNKINESPLNSDIVYGK
jgi:hypothetical protein